MEIKHYMDILTWNMLEKGTLINLLGELPPLLICE